MIHLFWMVGGYLAAVLCSEEHRTNRTCDVYALKYKCIAQCTYRSIQKLDSCHALALQLFQFVILFFFHSRNMRDSCLFYIIITLHFITFGLFSSYMCILLLFLLIYSVHLKLFANFIWCRRMPSFFCGFFKIYCILYNGVWLSIMFSFYLHLPNKQATADVDRRSFLQWARISMWNDTKPT